MMLLEQMHAKSVVPELAISRRAEWSHEQPISYLIAQQIQNPGVVSLAAGLVDAHSLPGEALLQGFKTVLSQRERSEVALQYGATPGMAGLREQLLHHLAYLEHGEVEDLGITADEIVVTTGSQQLLSLVTQALLDPGDIVLVAAPTYFVFLGTLKGSGARVVSVAADEQGMRMDALAKTLEDLAREGELHRVKLIYVVSYYENPTGLSLGIDRRPELVELVRKWSVKQRILILEDAAYRELRYDGPEAPSIWSFDTSRDYVIGAYTFSKSFSPGLRVGFGVLPKDLVGPVCHCKGNDDFGSANLNQHVLSEVFAQGAYYPHVRSLQQMYREKRDAMLAAVEREFSALPGVSWVPPQGGLYVWVTLPSHVDTSFGGTLFPLALKTHQVMYVPGDFCFAGEEGRVPRNHMRLSFGTQSPTGIAEGVRRLAQAVGQVI